MLGEIFLTIRDIARQSGYAVTTVSRVLNDQPNVSNEAREKILEVVRRNNFRLNSNARRLKQQHSSGVAVVVKGARNLLFSAILERLQSMLVERGFACFISYVDEDGNEVEEATRICREERPEGIMFLGGDMEHFERDFEAVTVPSVLITGRADGLGYENLSSISTDDSFAAECAIEHLMSLGHRSIGILGGQLERSYPSARRYEGCVRAFERFKEPFNAEIQYVESRFSLVDGYAAMKRLLNKMPDLTAVFAMSDVTAIGAIRAIRDEGLRVPEDISVMGFDGIELGGYLTPKLATIRQDGDLLARRSVEILVRAVRDNAGVSHEIVPFRLFFGESAREVDLM